MKLAGLDSLIECNKYPNANPGLARWVKLTKAAERNSLLDVKSTFPATDYIPQNRFSFEIGGNNHRLLTAISFQLGVVTILDCTTHAEYERKDLNTG